jgi:hypothetical protein
MSDAEIIYAKRKALVAHCWKQYQVKKDPRWLAEICTELPFFEHPEVGAEIARLLAKRFHKVDQIFEQTRRAEVIKLWQLLEGTDTHRAVYDKIADILYDSDHEAREKIRKIIEAK